MRYSEEFRDKALVHEIARRMREIPAGPARIMEVCGTHTMAAARFGLRWLLPESVTLVSGPGCPVCVTAQRDLDAYLALGRMPDAVLVSFGDMLRVPGTSTSLEWLRAEGADVRVVYSPLDGLDLARKEPEKQFIFFGVGFETTMPAVAVAIRAAAGVLRVSGQGRPETSAVGNLTVFCAHKTMPKALRALLAGGDVSISGLLCPGHVTTIIGAEAYEFIPREFGIACTVAGFEPLDMMLGIESILRQIAEGKPQVNNVYQRAVRPQANPRAAEILADVFEPCDAEWRGLGTIPGSGARIRDTYARFDAAKRFGDWITDLPTPENTPCRCGEVLRGVIDPPECARFGNRCTPFDPLGPCMVSSEGACAAAYRYGGARP